MGAFSAVDGPPTGWGSGPAGFSHPLQGGSRAGLSPGAGGRPHRLEVVKPLSGARDVTSCEGRPSFRPPLGVRSEGRAARGGDLASRAPPVFPLLAPFAPFLSCPPRASLHIL